MLNPEELKQRIVQNMPDAEVVFQDLTGTGDHFQAVVVSSAFAGKSPVEQHQMVYALLGEELKSGALHALALKTYTPEQWKRRKGVLG